MLETKAPQRLSSCPRLRGSNLGVDLQMALEWRTVLNERGQYGSHYNTLDNNTGG